MIQIQTSNSIAPDFTTSITLEDVLVSLRFKWNTLSAEWVLIKYEEPDNEIEFYGIKVKPYWNLLNNLVSSTTTPSLSGGLMVVTENETIETAITYENFGEAWFLVYLDEDELEEMEADFGL